MWRNRRHAGIVEQQNWRPGLHLLFSETPSGELTLPRQGQRQNRRRRPLTSLILERELQPPVLKSRVGLLKTPSDSVTWRYGFKRVRMKGRGRLGIAAMQG